MMHNVQALKLLLLQDPGWRLHALHDTDQNRPFADM